MTRWRMISAACALAALACGAAGAAELSKGTPDWKSAGPMAFGPDGLLFLADTQGAAIFAIDTGDRRPGASAQPLKVDALNEKVAALLGTSTDRIAINELAVNPASGRVYVAVARGTGPDAKPALVRIDRTGQLEVVSLENVPFAKATLPNPTTGNGPRSPRSEAITDLAFVDGRVFVAGLSNEEFSSRLLSIPYPFANTEEGTSIEIYHGAHGKFETKSPVRTFAAYKINGESYLLAAYQCTPLVKIPVAELKPGSHVKGTTVAELGNRNRPLDMIVYQKDGKDYLLLANNSRGVMKVQTQGVDKVDPITSQIKDGNTAGLPYETVSGLKGVVHLDELDKDHAVILVQSQKGALNLETIALP